MRLIWCQAGNPKSALVARRAGWWYGFRSDGMNYASRLGPVALIDCHWLPEKLDWSRHLDRIASCQPGLATIPDAMENSDLPRVLVQIDEVRAVSPLTRPLVVPKCHGIIDCLPRDRGIVLGYSVPTSYGAAGLGLWQLKGWPVHLLGGTPRRQLEVSGYLDVVSVDGNLTWLLARRGIITTAAGVGGETIKQMDGKPWPESGAHLEVLRRSMDNLRAFWTRHRSIEWSPSLEKPA